MKKILFFIPSLAGRGAEKALVNLVNNLDKKKYRITVMVLFDTGINKKNLLEHIEYKFIFKKIFRGNQYILKLFPPQILYKLFIKDNYDILIAYLEGIPTRILAGNNDPKVKKIAWVHTQLISEEVFFRPYKNIKEGLYCYKQYDKIVGVANTVVEALEKSIGMSNKMCVKYNLIETEKVLEQATQNIEDIVYNDNCINLITVGSLTEVKGYRRLIEILNNIYSKVNKFHLYILGEGELQKTLEDDINKYNLNHNITLLGYRENPYKYISRADLFICSSYREGFSTAVTEALIVGTPVITTLCSGMNELLKNGMYGMIVENNFEGLEEGLMEIISNKNKLEHYKKMSKIRGEFLRKDVAISEIEKLLDEI